MQTEESSIQYSTKNLIMSCKLKVVHITTIHKRFDSRIYHKECCSLARAGFDVSLIVSDNKMNEVITLNGESSVKILDIGIEKNRLKKLFASSFKAYRLAKRLRADVYHFHDPDFLIFGALLKNKNNRVYFDSHEDFPALMKQRDYIPSYLRTVLFLITTLIEKICTKRISGVFTATDNIRDKFLGYGVSFARTIKNYPIIPIFNNDEQTKYKLENTICYVGGLVPIRGVKEMVIASYKAGVKLLLAGPFDSEQYHKELEAMKEWECVEYLGFVPHDKIEEIVYSKANIGLVVLHDAPNHRNSIPIKFLEYMSSGLPIIASKDILFCKEVIEDVKCGIIVDPLSTDEIAKAINTIINDRSLAKDMSQRGKNAAINIYNWQAEKKKLIETYKS